MIGRKKNHKKYPTPVREGLGLIPARVKLYSVYSMDVMIIPPMTCLTFKEAVKSLMVGRKTTNNKTVKSIEFRPPDSSSIICAS